MEEERELKLKSQCEAFDKSVIEKLLKEKNGDFLVMVYQAMVTLEGPALLRCLTDANHP